MCHPAVYIVMAMMSAVQADQANKAQNAAAEASAEGANVAATFKMEALATKRGEVDEAAAAQKLQRQLQTKREHGRATVAAGEAGVGGNSTLRAINNALMQGGYDTSVIEANRMSKARQLNTESYGAHLSAESQVNVAETQTVSPAMGAMNVGIAGVSGYMSAASMGKSFEAPTMTVDKPISNVNDPYP